MNLRFYPLSTIKKRKRIGENLLQTNEQREREGKGAKNEPIDSIRRRNCRIRCGWREILGGRGKMTRVANINNEEERRGEERRGEAIEGGN